MQVTTYSRSTGELGAVLSGPTTEIIDACIDAAVAGWVEGVWSPVTHQVDLATGEVVAKAG